MIQIFLWPLKTSHGRCASFPIAQLNTGENRNLPSRKLENVGAINPKYHEFVADIKVQSYSSGKMSVSPLE